MIQEPLDNVVLSKMPIGRLDRPGKAAAPIAWLASEDRGFCVGAVFDLSGGRAVCYYQKVITKDLWYMADLSRSDLPPAIPAKSRQIIPEDRPSTAVTACFDRAR